MQTLGRYLPRLARRTRRQLARSPVDGLGAQDKVHRAAVREDVFPRDPGLVPGDAVDGERLHVVRILAEVLGRDDERLPAPFAVVKVDLEIREPRRADEERRLRRQRVQPDDVPEQPALHGAGVRVPRESGGGGGEVRARDGAGAAHGEVRAAREGVEVRRGEARLVPRVEERVAELRVVGAQAGREHGLEARDESRGAAAERDQRRHVVVRVERVLDGQRLVVRVAPVAAAAAERVLRHPGAGRRGARAQEAGEVERGEGRVPLVPPVARAREVFLGRGGFVEALGYLVEGEVVCGTRWALLVGLVLIQSTETGNGGWTKFGISGIARRGHGWMDRWMDGWEAHYSIARLTERPYLVVMYPRSIQSARAPLPSFVDDDESLGSLLFGGTVSASVTMAAKPSSQFTAPRTPFTYASARTLSALDPPCVAPLKNEERASGMKSSNRQMSIRERMNSS